MGRTGLNPCARISGYRLDSRRLANWNGLNSDMIEYVLRQEAKQVSARQGRVSALALQLALSCWVIAVVCTMTRGNDSCRPTHGT